uniref:RNA binding motif protein 12Ba n=1 Tax=Paramormyrops kingsleyae TaxID=1676925 RepID=A0A3B3T1I9_9TELE|nr:RNA-binding protein 12B-like [Paramormyrops kingsleyae]XP_023668282.1 RNA-binding protein 12B-like [Paramormyrops kingsleyae]
MAVVQLLGLSMEAGSGDIREFFSGLHIPEGGVHITGGSLGEAFIVFAEKEDGQLALQKSGTFLKGSHVVLSVSSEAELRQKMISCLKRDDSSGVGPDTKLIETLMAANKPEVILGFLLSLVSDAGKMQLKQAAAPSGDLLEVTSHNGISPAPDTASAPLGKCPVGNLSTAASRTCYLSIRGLPRSVTKHEICNFFKGLKVKEVIINAQVGHGYRGCLVKFASEQESHEGLKYSGRSLGSFCVDVNRATEGTWFTAIDHCKMASYKNQKDAQREMRLLDQSQSRPPMEQTSDPLPSNEYCVMIQNLNRVTTKTEIKDLFKCANVPNNRLLHLLDNWGRRTDTAFILFDKKEDCISALDLDRYNFCSRILSVSVVSKEEMRAMMKRHKSIPSTVAKKSRIERLKEEPSCIYVRNLPSDVRKIQIKDFFGKFQISEDCIYLLSDNRGVGLGEAVVMFESVQSAKLAEQQNGKNFLGAPLILTLITTQQVKGLLNGNR